MTGRKVGRTRSRLSIETRAINKPTKSISLATDGSLSTTPTGRSSIMAYKTEHFVQGHGCKCERCKVVKDTDCRLIILETGDPGHAYLCVPCIREILALLEARCTYHNTTWTMSKQDFMNWVDPNWKNANRRLEDITAKMGEFDGEFSKMGRDFLELKNGYTDRNKFFWDLKAYIKKRDKAIEELLK